jgi:hypothetical protein
MPSGRKLRTKKEILNQLEAAGVTGSIPLEDNADLTDLAFYQSGSLNAAFSEGSTTMLSDAVSGDDSVWQLLGYDGETSANTAGFFNSGSIHRYISYAGQTARSLTDSNTVILYSKDGPQAYFNQAYVPSAYRVNGTGSITFSSAISGAAGNLSRLKIYVAGAFPTASTGTVLTVKSGSTAIITYNSSSYLDPADTTASFPASFTQGISGSIPSPGDLLRITIPAGYNNLANSSSYTIQIVTGSLTTPPSNTMYIVTGAAGINLTGSTFHGILKSGINGTAVATTSSLGTGFSSLYNYISASNGGTVGLNLYAAVNGVYGRQISVSGSSNKIKKVAGVNYFQFEPYFATASFTTASMGTLTIEYSSSAATANLNQWAPGVIIYITGSSAP